MGQIVKPGPVKLIAGLMWNTEATLEEILEKLSVFGVVESRTETFDFNFTEYYLSESGSNLKKIYLTFRDLVGIDDIPELKLKANVFEEANYTREGKRFVNFDPGYISEAKLVMATTKNLPHRVYIGQNLFADLQLIYKKPTFRTIPWTFADIKQEAVIAFFNGVRDVYMKELKSLKSEGQHDSI